MSRTSSARARLELPVTALPGFAPLVGGSLWGEWASQGRVFATAHPARCIRYLRLKSMTSCRLLFDSGAEALPGVPELWQVRLFPDAQRARGHFDKIRERKPWLAADPRRPFLDETMAAVGTPFPVDDELRTLRHCFRTFRLRGVLEELLARTVRRSSLRTSLLSYKPGRRAVLQLEADPKQARQVARVVRPDAVEELARHLRTIDDLCRQAEIDCGPDVVGVSSSLAFVLCGYRPGSPIRRSGAVRAGSLDALRSCAVRLATLHQVEPTAAMRIRDARPRRAAIELVDPLAGLVPDQRERIEQLAHCVDARTQHRRALVHGDLHLGQILEDGSLIDWDQAGRGDPVDDLGSLLAHMQVARAPASYRECFLEAYQSARGARVDPRELAHATASSLFFRLGEPFRKLDPDWPRRTRALLDRAERLAEGTR